MQIQISWLLEKPTDLDLHYLQRQGISRFSRTRVKRSRKLPFNRSACTIHCDLEDRFEHIQIQIDSWSRCWRAKAIATKELLSMGQFFHIQMSRNIRKHTFRNVHPAKIQISQHIHAVWSESSLGTYWIAKVAKYQMQTMKTLIRLCLCTD